MNDQTTDNSDLSSENPRRSSRQRIPKRPTTPEPLKAVQRKKSLPQGPVTKENEPVRKNLPAEFYSEALDTLSILTNTIFDLQMYLPKRKKNSNKIGKDATFELGPVPISRKDVGTVLTHHEETAEDPEVPEAVPSKPQCEISSPKRLYRSPSASKSEVFDNENETEVVTPNTSIQSIIQTQTDTPTPSNILISGPGSTVVSPSISSTKPVITHQKSTLPPSVEMKAGSSKPLSVTPEKLGKVSQKSASIKSNGRTRKSLPNSTKAGSHRTSGNASNYDKNSRTTRSASTERHISLEDTLRVKKTINKAKQTVSTPIETSVEEPSSTRKSSTRSKQHVIKRKTPSKALHEANPLEFSDVSTGPVPPSYPATKAGKVNLKANVVDKPTSSKKAINIHQIKSSNKTAGIRTSLSVRTDSLELSDFDTGDITPTPISTIFDSDAKQAELTGRIPFLNTETPLQTSGLKLPNSASRQKSPLSKEMIPRKRSNKANLHKEKEIEITSVASGREPRNRSKPVFELAPSLVSKGRRPTRNETPKRLSSTTSSTELQNDELFTSPPRSSHLENLSRSAPKISFNEEETPRANQRSVALMNLSVFEGEPPGSSLSNVSSNLAFNNDEEIFSLLNSGARETPATPKPTIDRVVITPKPIGDLTVNQFALQTAKFKSESEDSVKGEWVEPALLSSAQSDELAFKSPEGIKKNRLKLNVRSMLKKRKDKPKAIIAKKKVQPKKQKMGPSRIDASILLTSSTDNTSTVESPVTTKRISLVGQPPTKNSPVLPVKEKRKVQTKKKQTPKSSMVKREEKQISSLDEISETPHTPLKQNAEIDEIQHEQPTQSTESILSNPADTEKYNNNNQSCVTSTNHTTTGKQILTSTTTAKTQSPTKRAASEDLNMEARQGIARQIRATSDTPRRISTFDDDAPWSAKYTSTLTASGISSSESDAESTDSHISVPEKVVLPIFAMETESPYIEIIYTKEQTKTPRSAKKLTPLLLPPRSSTRERKPLRTNDFIYEERRRTSISSTPIKTPIIEHAAISKRLSEELKSPAIKRERKPTASKEYPIVETKIRKTSEMEIVDNKTSSRISSRTSTRSVTLDTSEHVFVEEIKVEEDDEVNLSIESDGLVKLARQVHDEPISEPTSSKSEKFFDDENKMGQMNMPEIIIDVSGPLEKPSDSSEQPNSLKKKLIEKKVAVEVAAAKKLVFSQAAKIDRINTRSMSFKAEHITRRQSVASEVDLRPRSSTIDTVSPVPGFGITPIFSHSLIHGRESRNKSKPIGEFAPSLLKQEKRKLSLSDVQSATKKRRLTIPTSAEVLTPPTQPLQISIPSASVPDLMATLQEAADTLLKAQPILHPIPTIPAFPDVSKAKALPTKTRKTSKQPFKRLYPETEIFGPLPSAEALSKQSEKEHYSPYGKVEQQADVVEMPIFDRLNRRKVNPFALGVAPRKEELYDKDFFYREIFMKNPIIDDKFSPTLPDDINVVEKDESLADEILRTNPADACAEDIVKILPRIHKVPADDDEDEDSTKFTVDELKEIAQYEPKIVSDHLMVLLKWIAYQRLTDISTLNITGGCSMFYSLTMKNANRMRENLKLYSTKLMDSITTAHNWLLERLSLPLLASYLNLLRFLFVAGSGLSKHVTTGDEKLDPKINEANRLFREFALTKIQDPLGKSIKDNLNKLERINASVLFVSPKITTPNYNPNIRAHEMISQLLPTCIRVFESLKLDFQDVQEPVNIENLTHMSINLIRKSVKDLIRRRQNDHIFVVGWGTTCLLNHAAIKSIRGVSGLLNFAFPTETVYGSRGDVEDDILLTYCPTLFVVGEHASDCNLQVLQRMRENMVHESGLIVLGGANSNLYVSALRLSMERISQRGVARTILEHVLDFMQKVIQNSPPNVPMYRLQGLKPVSTHSPFDVGINLLKPTRSEKTTGDPPKTPGINANANQNLSLTKKEKSKKNADAMLQEKLRSVAETAIPLQSNKQMVAKMRPSALTPQELKKSFSQTPLSSPFTPKQPIQQHLQQKLQNPMKQKEFASIFGQPIIFSQSSTKTSAARLEFHNRIKQKQQAAHVHPSQMALQPSIPLTPSSVQPQQVQAREAEIREENAAVAALASLTTQPFPESEEQTETMEFNQL